MVIKIQAAHRTIADFSHQEVRIRDVLDECEIFFELEGRVIARLADDDFRSYVVHSASVHVQAAGEDAIYMGCARPYSPVILRQATIELPAFISLHLPCSSKQLERIENYRKGRSLNFGLNIQGISRRGAEEEQNEAQGMPQYFPVAHSQWVEKMNVSGLGNIGIFEV